MKNISKFSKHTLRTDVLDLFFVFFQILKLLYLNHFPDQTFSTILCKKIESLIVIIIISGIYFIPYFAGIK